MSFEASIKDLNAVVADLGLDSFALMGQSQGAAIAAAFLWLVRIAGETCRNSGKPWWHWHYA